MSKNFWRGVFSSPILNAAMAVLSVLCMAPSSCGGGSGAGLSFVSYQVPNPTTQSLSAGQVTSIVNQAVNAANALGQPAAVAVVDRVGNILAEVTTDPAPPANTTIASPTPVTGGLEGAVVPTMDAALSKAITAAYLSSDGNAFSTRTANEIIQAHFRLGITDATGGPLFGVQFSQLACSDLIQLSGGTTAGPHAAPLGLAADAGGLPLYINGVLVGGIGVMTAENYSLNPNPPPLPARDDEAIALAGTGGFGAPLPIQAPNILLGSSNNGFVALDYLGQSIAPAVAAAPPVPAPVITMAPTGGMQYGNAMSGIVPDANAATSYYVSPPAGFTAFPGLDAFVLVSTANTPRYPPTDSTTPAVGASGGITKEEAQALIGNALEVAAQTRAGIRIPTNSAANITASVVDLDGNVLALARSEDAPIFGIDVSLQKARTAVFFSRSDASSAYNEINPLVALSSAPGGTFAYYMQAQSLPGNASLFNSGVTFSEAGIGNLARPFYPDGIDGNPNGPLSLPAGNWSPFSTGLQTDLVLPDLVSILGGHPAPASGCGTALGLPDNTNGITQVANGLQIFSGGFPIYRGNEMVGAIGISGDGIQQDAMIAYLGIQGDASIGVSGVSTLNNTPTAKRDDTVTVDGVNLLYIQCPTKPFITSPEENPCM